MYLLTPPTAEPVTVDAARAALRIDDDRFDAFLPGLISAAREVAETETGRQLVQQTWRTELEDWPAATDVIPIYRATAAAVTYWNGSGWVALSGSLFAFGPNGNGTSLAPALNTSWPTLGDVAIGPRVRIDLTAGVDPMDATSTPDGIKDFIIALVGRDLDSKTGLVSTSFQDDKYLARKLDMWRIY